MTSNRHNSGPAPWADRPIAQLNLTWNGQQGTARSQIHYDEPKHDVLRMAAEMVAAGEVPGIDADRNVDLTDFVVQRFDAKDGLPNRIVVRPKTPFGATPL